MVSTTNPANGTKPNHALGAHPLDPLTQDEIRASVAAIRAFVKKGGYDGEPASPLFNTISLREPPKVDVLRWMGLFSDKEIAEVATTQPAPIRRQADLHIICNESKRSFEAIVDLPSNLPAGDDVAAVSEPTVSSWILLGRHIQPSLQTEELLWAEEICRKDPLVKEACDAVGISQEDLYVDGWCIAYDERFPERRLQQCFCFTRLRPGDNLYAHPCDFIPVIDSNTGEVVVIDYPHCNARPGEPHPPSSAEAHAKVPPRERFPPPAAPANYLPEQIVLDEPNFKLRDTLKPLHVIQPEGVSYKLTGRVIEWQNFKCHIGFTYREGLVLSGITYNDGAQGERPLFYRISVAEMVVPYAKTTFPHHRKQAFDTGEYGIGALSNSLALGCDCLGSITYLDANFITRAGGIQHIKSAICIHEEDAGILHKHTDFRDNKVHVARNRKLVISSICTVANYEYGFYFNFYLDGSIELEVKATGIVNAYPLREGEHPDPAHEVEVAPGIAAQHHQHLFSMRVDPMIDGLRNRLVTVDSVPDEADVGSPENFYGNGYHVVKTPFTKSDQFSDYDSTKARAWVIENPHKKHYATKSNIGYKIVCKDMPPMFAKPGSLAWNRAPWARHHTFVTRYHEDEIFPSELHINQHPGHKDFGLQKWVDRADDVSDTDCVVWNMFGNSHICRAEDWPLMPVEVLKWAARPLNFHRMSPCLDVPSTADPRSRYADEAFVGGKPGSHGANGASSVNGQSNGQGNGSGECCGG
ncbi:putative peroxisomal copper amine oxidase, partial [Cutaneotrichosporon oleaginosum]